MKGKPKMHVPPFKRGAASMTRDYLTQEGAKALGEMTAAAWRKCGHEVTYEIVVVSTRHNSIIYAPRFPTLIGGLPV